MSLATYSQRFLLAAAFLCVASCSHQQPFALVASTGPMGPLDDYTTSRPVEGRACVETFFLIFTGDSDGSLYAAKQAALATNRRVDGLLEVTADIDTLSVPPFYSKTCTVVRGTPYRRKVKNAPAVVSQQDARSAPPTDGDIDRELYRVKPLLLDCRNRYQRELRSIHMTITVTSDGHTDVSFGWDEGPFANCVRSTFATVSFPRFKGMIGPFDRAMDLTGP